MVKKKHTDQNKNWQTGFQWISGQIYYFDSNGNMQANKTVTDRGNTYQLKADGTLTSGNATIEKAISSGMTKVGNSPYVLGGGRTQDSIAANQFDCSSFTYWMYQQAGVSQSVLGVQSVTTTWTQQRIGSAVNFASMKRGDIFMMSNIGHVGLYLGGGYFIHSSPNAKFSTVYGGQAQPNITSNPNPAYHDNYYGGVGVSRLTDVLSRDPADGNHPVTRTTWEQIQDNVVRRIVN
jgi:cell wall-associated NlpC family hydrolase